MGDNANVYIDGVTAAHLKKDSKASIENGAYVIRRGDGG